MGNLFSSCFTETIPTAPREIKADPPFSVTIQVVIRRIGCLWGNYYSVYEGNEYPKTTEDVREKMWLWLRKTNLKNNMCSIDLVSSISMVK